MNKRVKKLQAFMKKEKIDAFLIRTFEGDNLNVLYLSGFGGTTGALLVTATKAFIIVDARYWIRAAQEATGFKLIKIERAQKLMDAVNDVLKSEGLGKTATVAFESAVTTVQVLENFKKDLKAKLVPTLSVIERFRQQKDEGEIEILRKACRVTSKVYNEVAAILKPGMMESEVAFELDMRLRKHGAISNSFTSIVASGPNSAIPHHATGNRKLKAGEPLIMDFGGLFPGGYCSDITRTAFVPGKKPDPKMVEIYNIVLGANLAARKALVAGVMWKDYDKVARDYIAERGYGKYFIHGLGHSLGLLTHDPYNYEKDPLDVGTVITDEPGIYIEGFGGVRIEDDLVVTTNGAERLTNAPYWKF